MLFAYDITVPANTLAEAPKTQSLLLTHGVITRIEVKFPAGCHGLVNVRILHQESVLVPVGKDTWLTGDDEIVPADMYYEFFQSPLLLKFHAKSVGTTYQHVITVRVTMLKEREAAPFRVLEDFLKVLKRLVGVS